MADPRARALDLLGWLGLAAAAALFAATAAVVQGARTVVGTTDLPWGLPVTLLTLGALVRAAVWWRRRTAAGALVALVWLAVTFVMAQSGPGGDVLLPDDWRSLTYLIAGVAVAAAAAFVPLPRQAPTAPAASGDVAPDR